MEALVTLLFFVALWGLARGLKLLGPRSPELRRLSDALTGGEAGAGAGGEPQPPAPDQPQAGAPPSPEVQPSTTTKP
ncbi:MAG: hypothetical protein HY916_02825 [Desulfovibrio sp.]|nr:hypothetical protein [Desulfovibrio sp.]